MEREKFCATLFAQMVEVYNSGRNSALCLDLQRRLDADVVVLLTCLLADAAGQGLDSPDFEAWVAAAADWREAVIRPLRRAREGAAPLALTPELSAFRERIKSLELEAEQHHAARLAAAFLPGAGAGLLAQRYLLSLGLSAAQAAAEIAAFTLPDATGSGMD